MPKRTLAALLALLVVASTLAVVAQPAAAHSQTTTKQHCSYDPFAGNQCWTETVTVSHTHKCGAGMTGTFPNCYPIPPANQNCGAGTTGTFPNCYPIPSDNTNNDGDDSGGDDGDDGNSGDGTDSDDGNSDDDSGDDDSGSDDSGDDDSGDDSGTTTNTNNGGSKDPCGDYTESLIAALNKVNDGTNTAFDPPARPAACKGMTTAEVQTWVDKIAGRYGTAVANAWRKVLEYQGEDAVEKAERYRHLGLEIEKLWDATPAEAKAAIVASAAGAGCFGLILAIVKTTAASGGTAAPAWVAWLASSAGKIAVRSTCALAYNAAGTAVLLIASQNDDDDPDPSDEKNVNNAKDDDESDNDDSDPPDSDAVAEAEKAAAKARADYQADRSWNNRQAFLDAVNRLRCLQPKLYICSTSR